MIPMHSFWSTYRETLALHRSYAVEACKRKKLMFELVQFIISPERESGVTM